MESAQQASYYFQKLLHQQALGSSFDNIFSNRLKLSLTCCGSCSTTDGSTYMEWLSGLMMLINDQICQARRQVLKL